MSWIPVYEYRGRSKTGEEVSGVIEAPSRSVATVRLRGEGIWIEALAEQGVGGPPRSGEEADRTDAPRRWHVLYGLHPVSPGTLSHFFSQLGSLYRAGVGMQTVVDDMAARANGPWLRSFLEEIRPRVAAGESLGNCLESYPQVFPAGVVGMVRTGELTGNLDEIARTLADEYLAEQRVRWVMLLPKLYFLAVVFIASLVLSFPGVITEGFDWWLDHVLRNVLPWWGVALLAWWVLKVLWHTPRGLWLRERLSYTLPVWSTLTRRIALYRFFRCLEIAVRAGVDFSVGLETAAQAAGNRYMVAGLRQAAARVRMGAPLHEALSGCPFMGRDAVGDLGAAATGGAFDETLPRMVEQAKAARDMFVKTVRTGAVVVGYGLTTAIVIAVVVISFVSIYRAGFELAGIEDLFQ